MKMRFQFDSADFTESTEELPGPARGWYRLYTFRVQREPDLEELKWCLSEDVCARVILDIGDYRDRDLDEAAFTHIRQILVFFDEHGKDLILRVTYDTEGKCLEHEPTLFSRVVEHIRQLGPALSTYSQRILLFEGMLVGNWGEMHGSRFLTKKYIEQLNAALAQSFPDILRAVRQPVQWRMLHTSPPGPGTTVGLFNDGLFGSDTDLGTFAPRGSENKGWETPWPAEQELIFEKELSAFVPQCGETVYGERYEKYTLRSTVERLHKMGMTCLNGVYDDRILRLWKGWAWDGEDPWRGISGYDYIGRHLGYRFCVTGAAAKLRGANCDLTVTVENTGFSGFYQEAEVWLILTEESGRENRILTDWDVRQWKSGQTVLQCRIPCCAGKLRLCARRKWDHAPIGFANHGENPEWVRIGEFKQS